MGRLQMENQFAVPGDDCRSVMNGRFSNWPEKEHAREPTSPIRARADQIQCAAIRGLKMLGLA
jgi:hypothetical protein